MAKHFKEAPAEATEQMGESSMTQRRRFGSHSRQNTTSLPYGQAATYHYSYPTAVPTQDFYTDGVEARGGIRRLGRGLLFLCAWAFRACALCLVLLVILNVFQFRVGRSMLTYVTDLVTAYLPWARFTVLGLDTPFGGTFRGDLTILATLAFICDWALCRARAKLL